MTSPTPPSAGSITVSQTIDLLAGPHARFARGVADGRYTLWLGSGISRDRLPDLGVLIKRVLGFLHDRLTPGLVGCPHRQALEQIVDMAGLRGHERATFALDDDPLGWPVLDDVIRGLTTKYSEMLAIEVEGESSDYLLWEGVDVPATYGGPGTPDCEHLCIAMLVLEGVVAHAVSANWDGLIEDAVAELTGRTDGVVQVVVLSEELRGPHRPMTLYKFHGCAVLAARDSATYRSALIGTRPRITAWTSDPDVKPIRTKMISLATEHPTLVIGLSAQDDDIQQLFAEAKAAMAWPWPTDPPAHVFSANGLGPDHLNILRVVYGDDYDSQSDDIRTHALVRAYGKPLLTALILHVLATKLRAYIDEVDAPHLLPGDRAALADGIAALVGLAADAAEPDRFAFVRNLIAAQRSALVQFRGEDRVPASSCIYTPLSTSPADRVHADAALATNGVRELAAALSLLGRGLAQGTWTLGRGALTSGTEGVVKVSAGGAEAAVFFAANGKAAARLVSEGDVDPGDDTVVLLHSTEPVATRVRSPRSSYGRTGRSAMREVDMSSLLRDAADVADLESAFRLAAAL